MEYVQSSRLGCPLYQGWWCLGKRENQERAPPSASTVRILCHPAGPIPTLQGGKKDQVGFPAASAQSLLKEGSGRAESTCESRVGLGKVPETADNSWWLPPRCEVSPSGVSQAGQSGCPGCGQVTQVGSDKLGIWRALRDIHSRLPARLCLFSAPHG